MNQVTSASLRYPLSVFNKNSTLKGASGDPRAQASGAVGQPRPAPLTVGTWSLESATSVTVRGQWRRAHLTVGTWSLESATSVTVHGQWRRAHLVSIDKSRRDRASKPHCDVSLSTRAAPCFGPALRKRRSARPLCAVHTRQRATGARTLPACLPCVVVLCLQRHCRVTLQCRPL